MRRRGMLVAAAACAALAGPAGPAWADTNTAQDTINDLQRQGYSVQIDRIGTGPMSKCVVTSVRNPQTLTQWVPYIGPGRGNRDYTVLVPVVTSQTISVSLDCTQR